MTRFGPENSLTQSFGKVARKMALLGFGLLLPAAGLAQEETEPEAPAQTAELHTAAIRDSVNARLLEDFKGKILSTIEDSGDIYSRYLDSLRVDSQQYARRHNTRDTVFVVNPLHFSIARMLDMDTTDEIARAFEERTGIPLPMAVRSVIKDGTTSQVNAAYDSRLDILAPHNTYSAETHINLIFPAQPFGMIANVFPEGPRAEIGLIPGLTPQQMRAYINGHENWHYKDRAANICSDMMRSRSVQMTGLKEDVDIGMTRNAFIYNMENFADIASLGEMIAQGQDIGIIDVVRSWRMANSEDLHHMSHTSLQHFKETVESIGVDAFRAKSPLEREEIYKNILAKNLMTPRILKKLGKIAGKDADPTKGISAALHAIEGVFNPNARRAVQFIKNYPDDAAVSAFSAKDKSLSRYKINETNAEWNDAAPDLLCSQALEKDGRITPVTLTRAYIGLQNEFLTKIMETTDPAVQQLEANKLLHLQKTLGDLLAEQNYVQLNEDYGVNLFEKEPLARDIANGMARTFDATPLFVPRPGP